MIQNLTAEYKSSFVSSLVILRNLDKFILGGKRLTLYEDMSRKVKNDGNSEISLVDYFYNPFYKTFYLITKNDLRVIDAKSGRLKNVYVDFQLS